MALDFPSSPTVGQIYNSGGTIWVWDGAKWVSGTTANVYAPIDSPVFTGNPTAPNQPAGDKDTSIANTAFVNAAVAPAFNGVGRNLIHNPLFNIAQRGVGSFSAIGYTLDRWRLAFVLDTVAVTQVQLTDTNRASIGDEEAKNAIAVAVTSNGEPTSFSVLDQYIENVRRLAGKTVTVSFWARAVSGTPKIGVAGQQVFGAGGSGVVPVNGTATPALSATMTRYSVTLTYPSIAGKTVGTAGDYSRLGLFFSSGADNNTFAGGIGVQSSTFVLWGVQVEIGTVATPLEKPDPRYDHANCLRFYRNSGMVLQIGFNAWGAAAFQFLPVYHPVPMRGTPIIALGAQGGATNIASANTNSNWPDGFWLQAVSVAAGGASVSYSGFSASADL